MGTEGPIKLGISKNVENRFRNLQYANHKKLNIRCVFKGGRFEEDLLKWVWQKYNIHGEWFKLSKEIIDFIELKDKDDYIGKLTGTYIELYAEKKH